MRYDELISEGLVDWLGSKWSELTDPALRAAGAERRAIEQDVAHNYQVLTQVALRQTDQSGRQITPRTFHKIPLNTIDEYLAGNMSLDDQDIRWILDHMGLRKLTLSALQSSQPLDSLFQIPGHSFDAVAARQFMQGLARLATMRFYRKQRMQGVDRSSRQKSTAPSQASTAQTTATSQTKAWQYGDPITVGGKTIAKTDKNYDAVAVAYENLLDVAKTKPRQS